MSAIDKIDEFLALMDRESVEAAEVSSWGWRRRAAVGQAVARRDRSRWAGLDLDAA